MNLIKAITFLLCSTLLVGQTTPIRNPQIQGASGAIISGATLTNSGTFVNSGTINGAGTFNFGSGTVTLPASSVTSGNITDGAVVNADINASAAIDISKLASSAITIAGTSTSLGGSITASAILDSISSTQGTILYRGASGWSALSPGTSGHFLKTQGAGANPMWDAVAGSGSVATDAIWDAAGDLAVGTGANTAARLAIGTSGYVLTSNGTTATWSAPTGGAFSALSDVDLTGIASGDMLKWSGTDWINRTAANVRTDLGLVIGTNVQAYDADLTTYAGITPSANMQSLLGAADYSAMRTQLGLGAAALLGTSIGGNGTGDSGKVVIFNANGGISLGKNDQTNTPLTIAISSGYGTVVTVEDFIGFGHYVELKGSDSVGFHAHVPGSSTGNHQGFTADMSGGTGINYGYQATVPSNGLVFLGSEYVNPLTSPRIAITATGDIHRYLNGTSFTAGTDKTILTFANPSGTKTITFPATTGTAVVTSSGAVALTTDTTGNYVADVAGTANEITSTHTPGEGSTATLSLPATIDIGGKTSFEIPNGASPTVDAFGEIAGDNNLWAASRGAPIFFDGTAATALVNVLVSDTPSNGQVPTWNTGGTITWETGGGATGYTVKTTTYTAVAGDRIAADVTGGAFTITLPVTPADGDVVEIVPAQGTFAANNLTIGRNSENIDGGAANATLTGIEGCRLVYRTGYGWRRWAMPGYSATTSSTVKVGQMRSDPSYGTVSDGSFTMGALSTTAATFITDAAGNAGLSSNAYNSGQINFICLAGKKAELTAEGALSFGQIATPSAPASNFAHIYSKDVAGTAEMFVMDEAGNETQISPHNHTAPAALVDSAFDEIGYTANHYTGLVTYTNKQRSMKLRDDAQWHETFGEHNTRLGLTGDKALVQLDWATVQAAHVAQRDVEREAWASRKTAGEAKPENQGKPFAETEPAVYTPKPQPQWLTDQLAGKAAFIAARDARVSAAPAVSAERQQIKALMADIKAGTGTNAERLARIEKALHRLLKDSLR